jgi:hypothetical protein
MLFCAWDVEGRGLQQQAEQLVEGNAEVHGAAAAGFDEDAEDGNAAAAGTLEGLLDSMVGAIGELWVDFWRQWLLWEISLLTTKHAAAPAAAAAACVIHDCSNR